MSSFHEPPLTFGQPENVPPNLTGRARQPLISGCSISALKAVGALFVGGLLLLLIGVILFRIFAFTPQSVFDTKFETIRANGEPVTMDELSAWYPAVPDNENAALVLQESFRLIRLPKDPDSLIPYMGNTRIEEFPRTFSADIKAASEALLQENAPCLEKLRVVATMRRSRFPLDFSKGFDMDLSHLAPLRSAVRLLVLDAECKADSGKFEEASQSLADALRVGETLRYEPVLISQLVRIAMHGIACRGIERVLNRGNVIGLDYGMLQSLLDKAEDTDSLYRSLVGEQCTVIHSFPVPGNANADEWLRKSGGGNQYWLIRKANLSLHTQDFDQFLFSMGQLIDSSKLSPVVRREEFEEVEAALDAMQANKWDKLTHTVTLNIVPPFTRLYFAVDRDAANLRTTSAGLAVAQYRSEHGQLPESIDALVPKYLAKVPEDPFNEQPLHYQPKDNGFTVYSVSGNTTDDQGVAPEKMKEFMTKGDLPFSVEW